MREPMFRSDLDRLAATRACTVKLVAGLSQERLDRVPANGGWSVGEVVDHILKAEALNRDQIARLVDLANAGRTPFISTDFSELGLAPPFVPKPLLPWLSLPFTLTTLFVPAAVREAFLRTRFLPAKAPDVLKPRRGRPAAALRADLEGSLATTRALFEDNPGLDFTRMYFQHPLLGLNNALDVLRLIDSHERRHQDQVREVLRRKGCCCGCRDAA